MVSLLRHAVEAIHAALADQDVIVVPPKKVSSPPNPMARSAPPPPAKASSPGPPIKDSPRETGSNSRQFTTPPSASARPSPFRRGGGGVFVGVASTAAWRWRRGRRRHVVGVAVDGSVRWRRGRRGVAVDVPVALGAGEVVESATARAVQQDDGDLAAQHRQRRAVLNLREEEGRWCQERQDRQSPASKQTSGPNSERPCPLLDSTRSAA